MVYHTPVVLVYSWTRVVPGNLSYLFQSFMLRHLKYLTSAIPLSLACLRLLRPAVTLTPNNRTLITAKPVPYCVSSLLRQAPQAMLAGWLQSTWHSARSCLWTKQGLITKTRVNFYRLRSWRVTLFSRTANSQIKQHIQSDKWLVKDVLMKAGNALF